MSSFLSDIEFIFFKRAVIYADVGANDGSAFETMLETGFSVDRAVLIEANPNIFARLQETIAARNHKDRFTCLNLAMSDQRTDVRMRDKQYMSRIVPGTIGSSLGGEADAYPDQHFEVEAHRFDDLASLFPDGHVSILKIGVQGQECEVLRGCESMLAAHAIDVLYVEAGANADNPQQAHFREIDDIVISHGYRLFRIYEQTHEWIEDLPVLRQFNVAYLSPVIAARYPMTMARELLQLRRRLDASEKDVAIARTEVEALSASLKERFEEIALLTRSVVTLSEERHAALSNAQNEADQNGKLRKIRLLIGGALLYSLALAGVFAFLIWFF